MRPPDVVLLVSPSPTLPAQATEAALADNASMPDPLATLRATLLEGIRVTGRVNADAARLRATLRELQHAMRSDHRARREVLGDDDHQDDDDDEEDGNESLGGDDSMGEEEENEYGGGSSMGSSDGSAAQAPVYLLRCGTCETELTRRGMQVPPA
jgi:hypothetical protein